MINKEQYEKCLLRVPSDNLDLFHDVILELDAHPPDGVRSIEAVIPRRVKHRKIDLWRRRQRFLAEPDGAIESQLSREQDPSQELAFNESCESVHKFMLLLKPNHQEILKVVYFDGISLEQIAESRGCTPQSVQAMLTRAKTALKQLFDQHVKGRNS